MLSNTSSANWCNRVVNCAPQPHKRGPWRPTKTRGTPMTSHSLSVAIKTGSSGWNTLRNAFVSTSSRLWKLTATLQISSGSPWARAIWQRKQFSCPRFSNQHTRFSKKARVPCRNLVRLISSWAWSLEDTVAWTHKETVQRITMAHLRALLGRRVWSEHPVSMNTSSITRFLTSIHHCEVQNCKAHRTRTRPWRPSTPKRRKGSTNVSTWIARRIKWQPPTHVEMTQSTYLWRKTVWETARLQLNSGVRHTPPLS